MEKSSRLILTNLSQYNLPDLGTDFGLVYYLLFKGKVIYVGKSKNSKRPFQHSSKPFDDVRYEVVPLPELNSRERDIIAEYHPVLNGEYRNKPVDPCQIIGGKLFIHRFKKVFDVCDHDIYHGSSRVGFISNYKQRFVLSRKKFHSYYYFNSRSWLDFEKKDGIKYAFNREQFRFFQATVHVK